MAFHIRTPLSNSQLFFDDSWVDSSTFIRRQWHAARRHPDPVIKGDKRWENHCPVMYGSVLFREGKFRAWYPVWTRDIPMRVCYAESDNGIDWVKPSLGQHEVFGSKENNIILVSDSPACIVDDLTVIDDPGDGQWPLKMLYWDGFKVAKDKEGGNRKYGCHLARSRDGIVWEKCGQVLHGYGDRFNALPVKFKGKFRALVREPGMMEKYHQRVASYLESADLKRWSAPVLALAPDTQDPAYMEVYSVVPFLYEGLVVGGIERMHKSPDKLDTEIAWSREGKTWARSCARASFIPWGQSDRWDDTWINLSSSQPIRVGNDLWFYYSGRHGAHYSRPPGNFGGIGLATLRADGFCSLHATEQPGWFGTPVFTWPGGELLVNADCRRDLRSYPGMVSGSGIRVEVRDAEGKPIKGYELESSLEYKGNSWTVPGCFEAMKWRGEEKLDGLKGRKVRLHFVMRDAHLFAFKAGAGGVGGK